MLKEGEVMAGTTPLKGKYYVEEVHGEFWAYPIKKGDVVFSQGKLVDENNCEEEIKEAIEVIKGAKR